MNKFSISLLGLSIFLGSHNLAIAQAQVVSLKEFSKTEENNNKLYKAFEVLQQRNNSDKNSQDYRTSLQYWANIHGYFTKDRSVDPRGKNLREIRKAKLSNCFNETFKPWTEEEAAHWSKDEKERWENEEKERCAYYKKTFEIIPEQSVKGDSIAEKVWGTCPHGSDLFLPWHRMYLYFFNQNLKKTLKDDEFELPYWKYEDNYDYSTTSLSLPKEFTNEGKSTYNKYRTLELNSGKNTIKAYIKQQPEPSQVYPDQQSGVDILATEASSAEDFYTEVIPGHENEPQGFSNIIESNPHGLMHCGIGSNCVGPYIGIVAAAGNDPIFYLHHRNIDRLWQQWMLNKSNGQEITLEWAKANLGMPAEWFDKKMVFVDGDGIEVTVTVADTFNPKYMPKYKDIKIYPSIGPKANIVKSSPISNILSKQNILVLGSNPKPIDLSSIPKSHTLKGISASSSKVFLTIEDIVLINSPLNTYGIYLVNKNTGVKSILKTFSFFGINEGSEGEHEHHSGSKLPNVNLDISKDLAMIGAKDLNEVSITFEATDLTTKPVFIQKNDSGLSIGKILLYSK